MRLLTIDASACSALAVCACGWRSPTLTDAAAAQASAGRHYDREHRDTAARAHRRDRRQHRAAAAR